MHSRYICMNRRRLLQVCSGLTASAFAGCSNRFGSTEMDEHTTWGNSSDVQTIPEYDATHHPIVSDTQKLEQLTHEATNRARIAHSREPLAYDSELANIARLHSRDMANHDFFGHENQNGELHVSRLQKYGYNSTVVYENLYSLISPEFDYSLETLAQMAVDAWLDSPSHRRALLKEHNTEEGIGVYVTDEPRIYWTAELSKYDVDRQTPTQ